MNPLTTSRTLNSRVPIIDLNAANLSCVHCNVPTTHGLHGSSMVSHNIVSHMLGRSGASRHLGAYQDDEMHLNATPGKPPPAPEEEDLMKFVSPVK